MCYLRAAEARYDLSAGCFQPATQNTPSTNRIEITNTIELLPVRGGCQTFERTDCFGYVFTTQRGLTEHAKSSCASLALLLGFKYLRAVSDPINQLINIANLVSRERDYSLRATKYPDDDLGEPTEESNDMLQQIQSRDAEWQQEISVR